jgi:hypothetical protein
MRGDGKRNKEGRKEVRKEGREDRRYDREDGLWDCINSQPQ